jgi:hypothetical protein
MIVIHIGRKPFPNSVAQNALQYGTGGLNIKACRIGSDIVGWMGGTGLLKGWGRDCKEGEPRPVAGRWPANLVLEHDPRCILRGRTLKDATEVAGLEVLQYQEDWSCVEGCPAKEIQLQKGTPDFFLQIQKPPKKPERS